MVRTRDFLLIEQAARRGESKFVVPFSVPVRGYAVLFNESASEPDVGRATLHAVAEPGKVRILSEDGLLYPVPVATHGGAIIRRHPFVDEEGRDLPVSEIAYNVGMLGSKYAGDHKLHSDQGEQALRELTLVLAAGAIGAFEQRPDTCFYLPLTVQETV